MRDYEVVLVVSPDVGDEGFPATVERVSKFITDRGGEIKNTDQWGRRRLAYPIRRANEAFYAVTHFTLEPTEVRALEGNLDLAEDILRHLVVRFEEVPPPVPRRERVPAAAAVGGPPIGEAPSAPAEEPAVDGPSTQGEEQ